MRQTQSSFLGLKSYQDFWETGPCSSGSPSLLPPVPRGSSIPVNFFQVKCMGFYSYHDQNFWKHPSNFWRSLTIFLRLLNVAETIWRCSDHIWALLKLFQRENFSVYWYSWPQIFSRKLNCTFVINHVLKNNSCGFASQAWEVVLDAWDWCLRFADTRLAHEAWELASINAWGYSLIWPTWKCATGQDMVFVLSVLHRVCYFVNVCPKQGI